MMKNVLLFLAVIILVSFNATPIYAHAGVVQKEVGIGSIQTFSFGVPNEKDDATTIGVRIVIPEGVEDVMPNVKPGWTITVNKSGEGEEARVTEVAWTGGDIPPGQRDEVSITAQAPAEETTLIWKAYQTYSDGEVVAWDTDPKIIAQEAKEQNIAPAGRDAGGKKPYSTTRVINDLKASPSPAAQDNTTDAGTRQSNTTNLLSIAAIAMSAATLGMQFYNKNKTQK